MEKLAFAYILRTQDMYELCIRIFCDKPAFY